MSQIGTVVSNTETPAATNPSWDTANAFVVGLADWGPVGPTLITNQPGVPATVGPRSGTNITLYDSLDVFFREGGTAAFVSRVVGASASAATLTLNDGGSAPALLLTAQYVGEYGSQLNVTVANAGSSVTITLTDDYGNALSISPVLTTPASIVSWFATTGYITAIKLGSNNLPATISAASLSGGTSDRSHITLANYTNALNAFPTTLGPGQVLAPGVTNTTVSGIWTALASHAAANNRVALGDIDDNVSAATAISAIGASFQSAQAGPIGFWAGNLLAQGVVPNTTRSIPPSAVIAALCCLVDQAGNPNIAAAGTDFPTQYCTGPFSVVTGIGSGQTYSATDVNSLNSAGINTFVNNFVGGFQNYGFSSSILPANDTIYWQLSHGRLRMAITASAQIVAQPFVFSQLDGQGSDILSFGSALSSMLNKYYIAGALYGTTPDQAYNVNVGPQINPPAQLQLGILSALLNIRLSPYAQLVSIVVNSVPITLNIPS